MSETVSVEFAAPSGDELRFDWDLGRLRSLDPAVTDPPLWRLSGELDWDEVDRVRVLSASYESGSMLTIAAIRPAGVAGHGEEAITGLVIDPERGPEQLGEVLFSAEHGAEGALERIGLELYRHESGLPIRVAGEPTAVESHPDGRVDHRHYVLSLRGPDGAGVAALDVLATE